MPLSDKEGHRLSWHHPTLCPARLATKTGRKLRHPLLREWIVTPLTKQEDLTSFHKLVARVVEFQDTHLVWKDAVFLW